MKSNIYKSACILIMTTFFTLPVLAELKFESPVMLKASTILPPGLVKGPHHQVDEKVVNDAYLNIYTIHTDYGDVQAVSTEKLRKYIHEIVAKMKEIEGSEEFQKGLTEKAGDVIKGAEGLITDPVGSVSDTISGVGKLFSRAGENMFGGSRSETEGSRMEDLLGYSKAKRDIGYEFGIDVYSHNKILQDQLNALAGASGTGTLVMSGLLMAVPGGAGVAVSVTAGSKLMANVMRDKAPADLRKMNRATLAAMGVHNDVADIFIANGIYTPLEQTLLVAAIDSMKNTSGREEYIKFATLTDNPDIAFFRQRQAQMYAAYNGKVKPLDSFIAIGDISAGKTKDGNIVFNVPLDHLLWTKGIAAVISVINQRVTLMEGINEKHLLVSGTISQQSRKALQKMGWKVKENADSILF